MNMRSTRLVAGVDEAGRGPLAGPVVVAAVVLDPRWPLEGLADSKALSPQRREALYAQITASALDYQVCVIEVDVIDRINILQATLTGMRECILRLVQRPHRVLIDGNQVPRSLPCTARAVVGGDALEPCISAASILAKVTRDRHMGELDRRYPGYGFADHKGYGTPGHLQALRRMGPCPEHRRSFAPVRYWTADLFGDG